MRSLRVLLLRGGDVDVRRRPDRGYLLGDGVVHGERRGRRYGRRLLLGFLDGGDRLGSLLDDHHLGLLLLGLLLVHGAHACVAVGIVDVFVWPHLWWVTWFCVRRVVSCAACGS